MELGAAKTMVQNKNGQMVQNGQPNNKYAAAIQQINAATTPQELQNAFRGLNYKNGQIQGGKSRKPRKQKRGTRKGKKSKKTQKGGYRAVYKRRSSNKRYSRKSSSTSSK
jgi:hypothetical protein